MHAIIALLLPLSLAQLEWDQPADATSPWNLVPVSGNPTTDPAPLLPKSSSLSTPGRMPQIPEFVVLPQPPKPPIIRSWGRFRLPKPSNVLGLRLCSSEPSHERPLLVESISLPVPTETSCRHATTSRDTRPDVIPLTKGRDGGLVISPAVEWEYAADRLCYFIPSNHWLMPNRLNEIRSGGSIIPYCRILPAFDGRKIETADAWLAGFGDELDAVRLIADEKHDPNFFEFEIRR